MLKVSELSNEFGSRLRSLQESQIPIPLVWKYKSVDHFFFMIHGNTMLMCMPQIV